MSERITDLTFTQMLDALESGFWKNITNPELVHFLEYMNGKIYITRRDIGHLSRPIVEEYKFSLSDIKRTDWSAERI